MHRRKHLPVESLDTPAGISIQETLEDNNERERQPEVAYEDTEFRNRIAKLLEHLPSLQGAAVMLKHGLDYKYPEIARIMHIPEKKAASLVKSGMRKLKAITSKQDFC